MRLADGASTSALPINRHSRELPGCSEGEGDTPRRGERFVLEDPAEGLVECCDGAVDVLQLVQPEQPNPESLEILRLVT